MRFRYTIQYIEGKQNDTPDCMSRKYGESDIPSLVNVIINHVGISAEDQAVTIPELAHEGAKGGCKDRLPRNGGEVFPATTTLLQG